MAGPTRLVDYFATIQPSLPLRPLAASTATDAGDSGAEKGADAGMQAFSDGLQQRWLNAIVDIAVLFPDKEPTLESLDACKAQGYEVLETTVSGLSADCNAGGASRWLGGASSRTFVAYRRRGQRRAWIDMQRQTREAKAQEDREEGKGKEDAEVGAGAGAGAGTGKDQGAGGAAEEDLLAETGLAPDDASHIVDVNILFKSLEHVPDEWELVRRSFSGRHGADLNRGGLGVYLVVRRAPASTPASASSNLPSTNATTTTTVAAAAAESEAARDDAFHSETTISDLCMVNQSKKERMPFGFDVISRDLNRGSYGNQLFLGIRKQQPLGFCDIDYEGVTGDRFPLEDYPDFGLPERELPLFCFPNGLHLIYASRQDAPLPRFFSFVFTNLEGTRLHAMCLQFWEALDHEVLRTSFQHVMNGCPPLRSPKAADGAQRQGKDDAVHDEVDAAARARAARCRALEDRVFPFRVRDNFGVFIPRCVCVVSHFPYYRALRRFLRQLYSVSLSRPPVPIERFISAFVSHVPVPVAGGRPFHVVMDMALVDIRKGERSVMQPIVLTLPIPRSFPHMDLDFTAPLRCLSVNDVLSTWMLLLSERKCLFLAPSGAFITEVMETFRALLFPCRWQCSFIPRLPQALMGCLEAPGGFMIGWVIESSSRERLHVQGNYMDSSAATEQRQAWEGERFRALQGLLDSVYSLDELYVVDLYAGELLEYVGNTGVGNHHKHRERKPFQRIDDLHRALPPHPKAVLQQQLSAIVRVARLRSPAADSTQQLCDMTSYDAAFEYAAAPDAVEWDTPPTQHSAQIHKSEKSLFGLHFGGLRKDRGAHNPQAPHHEISTTPTTASTTPTSAAMAARPHSAAPRSTPSIAASRSSAAECADESLSPRTALARLRSISSRTLGKPPQSSSANSGITDVSHAASKSNRNTVSENLLRDRAESGHDNRETASFAAAVEGGQQCDADDDADNHVLVRRGGLEDPADDPTAPAPSMAVSHLGRHSTQEDDKRPIDSNSITVEISEHRKPHADEGKDEALPVPTSPSSPDSQVTSAGVAVSFDTGDETRPSTVASKALGAEDDKAEKDEGKQRAPSANASAGGHGDRDEMKKTDESSSQATATSDTIDSTPAVVRALWESVEETQAVRDAERESFITLAIRDAFLSFMVDSFGGYERFLNIPGMRKATAAQATATGSAGGGAEGRSNRDSYGDTEADELSDLDAANGMLSMRSIRDLFDFDGFVTHKTDAFCSRGAHAGGHDAGLGHEGGTPTSGKHLSSSQMRTVRRQVHRFAEAVTDTQLFSVLVQDRIEASFNDRNLVFFDRCVAVHDSLQLQMKAKVASPVVPQTELGGTSSSRQSVQGSVREEIARELPHAIVSLHQKSKRDQSTAARAQVLETWGELGIDGEVSEEDDDDDDSSGGEGKGSGDVSNNDHDEDEVDGDDDDDDDDGIIQIGADIGADEDGEDGSGDSDVMHRRGSNAGVAVLAAAHDHGELSDEEKDVGPITPPAQGMRLNVSNSVDAEALLLPSTPQGGAPGRRLSATEKTDSARRTARTEARSRYARRLHLQRVSLGPLLLPGPSTRGLVKGKTYSYGGKWPATLDQAYLNTPTDYIPWLLRATHEARDAIVSDRTFTSPEEVINHLASTSRRNLMAANAAAAAAAAAATADSASTGAFGDALHRGDSGGGSGGANVRPGGDDVSSVTVSVSGGAAQEHLVRSMPRLTRSMSERYSEGDTSTVFRYARALAAQHADEAASSADGGAAGASGPGRGNDSGRRRGGADRSARMSEADISHATASSYNHWKLHSNLLSDNARRRLNVLEKRVGQCGALLMGVVHVYSVVLTLMTMRCLRGVDPNRTVLKAMGVLSQLDDLGLLALLDEAVFRGLFLGCGHGDGADVRRYAVAIFRVMNTECGIVPSSITLGTYTAALARSTMPESSSSGGGSEGTGASGADGPHGGGHRGLPEQDEFWSLEALGLAWFWSKSPASNRRRTHARRPSDGSVHSAGSRGSSNSSSTAAHVSAHVADALNEPDDADGGGSPGHNDERNSNSGTRNAVAHSRSRSRSRSPVRRSWFRGNREGKHDDDEGGDEDEMPGTKDTPVDMASELRKRLHLTRDREAVFAAVVPTERILVDATCSDMRCVEPDAHTHAPHPIGTSWEEGGAGEEEEGRGDSSVRDALGPATGIELSSGSTERGSRASSTVDSGAKTKSVGFAAYSSKDSEGRPATCTADVTDAGVGSGAARRRSSHELLELAQSVECSSSRTADANVEGRETAPAAQSMANRASNSSDGSPGDSPVEPVTPAMLSTRSILGSVPMVSATEEIVSRQLRRLASQGVVQSETAHELEAFPNRHSRACSDGVVGNAAFLAQVMDDHPSPVSSVFGVPDDVVSAEGHRSGSPRSIASPRSIGSPRSARSLRVMRAASSNVPFQADADAEPQDNPGGDGDAADDDVADVAADDSREERAEGTASLLCVGDTDVAIMWSKNVCGTCGKEFLDEEVLGQWHASQRATTKKKEPRPSTSASSSTTRPWEVWLRCPSCSHELTPHLFVQCLPLQQCLYTALEAARFATEAAKVAPSSPRSPSGSQIGAAGSSRQEADGGRGGSGRGFAATAATTASPSPSRSPRGTRKGNVQEPPLPYEAAVFAVERELRQLASATEESKEGCGSARRPTTESRTARPTTGSRRTAPHIDRGVVREVVYVRPSTLRLAMEECLLSGGPNVCRESWLREQRPHLYWSLVWFTSRLNLPLPLLSENLFDPSTRRHVIVPVLAWSRELAHRRAAHVVSRLAWPRLRQYTELYVRQGHVLVEEFILSRAVQPYGSTLLSLPSPVIKDSALGVALPSSPVGGSATPTTIQKQYTGEWAASPSAQNFFDGFTLQEDLAALTESQRLSDMEKGERVRPLPSNSGSSSSRFLASPAVRHQHRRRASALVRTFGHPAVERWVHCELRVLFPDVSSSDIAKLGEVVALLYNGTEAVLEVAIRHLCKLYSAAPVFEQLYRSLLLLVYHFDLVPFSQLELISVPASSTAAAAPGMDGFTPSTAFVGNAVLEAQYRSAVDHLPPQHLDSMDVTDGILLAMVPKTRALLARAAFGPLYR